MEVMENLVSKYKMEKDQRNEDKLSGEIERIEIEYSDAQNRAQQVIDTLSNPRTYVWQISEGFVNRADRVASNSPISHKR